MPVREGAFNRLSAKAKSSGAVIFMLRSSPATVVIFRPRIFRNRDVVHRLASLLRAMCGQDGGEAEALRSLRAVKPFARNGGQSIAFHVLQRIGHRQDGHHGIRAAFQCPGHSRDQGGRGERAGRVMDQNEFRGVRRKRLQTQPHRFLPIESAGCGWEKVDARGRLCEGFAIRRADDGLDKVGIPERLDGPGQDWAAEQGAVLLGHAASGALAPGPRPRSKLRSSPCGQTRSPVRRRQALRMPQRRATLPIE